jgi:hypothetical protein
MATETNNSTGNDTNNSDQVNNNSGATSTDDVTSDPVLSRHIDMAIEAQDGKPQTAATEDKSKTEQGTVDDKTKGSEALKTDSTGSTKDTTAQPKSDKEGKEGKGDTSRAKDLVLKGQGPDGTDLVISAGKERRFYEQLQTQRQRSQFLENEVKTRDDRYKDLETRFNTLNQSVQQINGLPPAHLAVAVRMFTDMQRDPSGTLKKLLAEAVSLGHTVEGIGAGVDVQAITAAVRAELNKETATREPTSQQIEADVQTEINNFYSRFPDARVHDPLIAQVIQDHPNLSLEDAYFQLKDGFAARGFDWSRTLEDNVKDETSTGTAQDTTNNGTSADPKKPLPNGGGTPSGSEPIEKHGDVMSENADFGDIIKSAMKDAGMNV